MTGSEFREYLVGKIDETAWWRGTVAENYPDDARNLRAVAALEGLATYVRGLDADASALYALCLASGSQAADAPIFGERVSRMIGRYGFDRDRPEPAAFLSSLADAARDDTADAIDRVEL